jgi:hypothetical protein
VSAFFSYTGIIQDDYFVCTAYGLQPVSDDDDSFILNQGIESPLYIRLVFGSREAVASSRSMGASFNKARAMEIRCFSPPERVHALLPQVCHNLSAFCDKVVAASPAGGFFNLRLVASILPTRCCCRWYL